MEHSHCTKDSDTVGKGSLDYQNVLHNKKRVYVPIWWVSLSSQNKTFQSETIPVLLVRVFYDNDWLTVHCKFCGSFDPFCTDCSRHLFWCSLDFMMEEFDHCFFIIHLEEEPQTPATPADPKVTRYGDVIEWTQRILLLFA